MPRIPRFFKLWSDSDKIMWQYPEASYSFEPRLERTEPSPLTNENANPRPTPYSTIMGTSGRLNPPNNQRTASDKLKAVKNLFHPKGTENQSPQPTPPRPPQPKKFTRNKNRDPLPDAMKDLEERLKYHVSELERMRRDISIMNTLIAEHISQRDSSRIRLEPDLSVTYEKLVTMVEEVRKCRNAYAACVGYHRKETRRIARKMVVLNGPQAPLPDIYKNLWDDEQWGQLFCT